MREKSLPAVASNGRDVHHPVPELNESSPKKNRRTNNSNAQIHALTICSSSSSEPKNRTLPLLWNVKIREVAQHKVDELLVPLLTHVLNEALNI